MAREISLQETLNDAVEHHLENSYFCMPGLVLRANLDAQQVDVQPSLNIKMFDNSPSQERPPILNVPLIYPASKTSAFTFPIQAGDTVLLVFSQRGLDSWKSGNGYPTTPVDYRMLDYKDAIAIPGLFPSSLSVNKPTKHLYPHSSSDAVIVHNLGQGNETEIRLLAGGGVVINTAQDVEVNCDNANVIANTSASINTPQLTVNAATTLWTGDIIHSGNYTQTGVATFNGIVFSTHKHGNSPPPSN